MSTLQVKNLPDDLHEKLRDRARSQHKTVSALVTELIENEFEQLSMSEWLDEVRKLPKHDNIDVLAALDAARDELEGR